MPYLSPFPPLPPLTCIFPKEGLRLSSYPINFVSLARFVQDTVTGLTQNVHLYLLVLKGVTCKIITDRGGGDFNLKVTGMLVRVFGTESHYIYPFRHRLGLCIKMCTKSAVTLTSQKSHF